MELIARSVIVAVVVALLAMAVAQRGGTEVAALSLPPSSAVGKSAELTNPRIPAVGPDVLSQREAGSRPTAGDPAHQYHFQVFALDCTLDLPAGFNRQDPVTARGELVGSYPGKPEAGAAIARR